MKEAGYDGKVAKDGVVFVETGISCWKFKLSENVIVLHYTTKSLYRGVRTLCLEFEQSATWEEKLHQILQKISETDEKFQFGVGSLKVQQMIEQIAVKFCHLCD